MRKIVVSFLVALLSLSITLVCNSQTQPVPTVPAQQIMPTMPMQPADNEQTEAASGEAGMRQWNLKDVDIRILIDQIAKLTQKNFIIDPSVSGKITLITTQPLSVEESYQVFLSVLQVYGYSAIDNGHVIKILPNREAKSQAKLASSSITSDTEPLDSTIVKVIHVHYVPVKTLADAITPLASNNSLLKAYPDSNDIIVADYVDNVNRISHLVNRIDVPSAENRIEVIKLHYGDPSEIANILSSMVSDQGEDSQPVKVAADERTNSLLVSGSLFQRIRMRALIGNLDKPTSITDEGTQVIYLTYIQAKDIAPILANIIEDYESKQRAQTGQKDQGSKASPIANSVSQQVSTPSLPSGNSLSNLNGKESNQSGGEGRLDNPALEEDNRARSGAVTTAVQWEETTNAVIIRAPKDLMRTLRSVIAKLDVRRMQVLVEVVIAEVDVNRARELGVEWNTDGDVRVSTRFPSPTLSNISGTLGGTGSADEAGFTPGRGLTLGFYHSDDLRGIIRALSTDTASDILATPDVVTLDNETATIKVEQLVPFAIGQSTNNLNEGGTPFTSFEREEVGLRLTIRPQITDSGDVIMHVDHILSNLVPGSAATNVGDNPTTNERVITTNVMVANGETLVLGGLIQNEYEEDVEQVPFLGDIPIIGFFFKSQTKHNVKRNLMIFLRPHIIADTQSGIIVSGERYERLRNAQMSAQAEISKIYRPTIPTLQPLDPVVLPQPFFMLTNPQTKEVTHDDSGSNSK